MLIEEILNKYEIEKLSEKHDLKNFSCGMEDMDKFLQDDALNQQQKNLNVSYLVLYNKEIIGFYSIFTDNIPYNKLNLKEENKYNTYPAVKIGRLAVSKKYKGNKIGTLILDNICGEIKKFSKKLGIKFVLVDSYCSIRKFYLKNYFNQIKLQKPKKSKRIAERNSKKTILMYKDIAKI